MYKILSIGRASVFVMPCFVLFCHAEISQTMVLHVVLLVS